MYCPNCGEEVKEGVDKCPSCGAKIESESQSKSTSSIEVKPSIQERNIALQIILSIVTCGIYGLYWLICMTDESNSVTDDPTASGGMTILFIILTCGIYSFYWYYKMGQKLAEGGRKYGVAISDNSILYLVLGIFGLGLISVILIQSDLNKLAKRV